MSELDDAMLSHMAYIVLHEHRPFSFIDFLRFEVDNRPYKMAYGTIRNEFSKLVKLDEIERCYKSSRAFYTLKGYEFGKSVTPNHTVVHNNPIYRMLHNLPLDKQSIHNIRLRFKVPNIWRIFSINSNFPRNKSNDDIPIPTWRKDNVMVRVFIHKTDVVSVIIATSLQPIFLDAEGIVRFFNTLVRIEEKLQNYIDKFVPLPPRENFISIPDYNNWIITMWHFGRDCLMEYAGEKFSITVENARHILTRVYSKEFNGKQKIRIESQEYPRKTVTDIIEEKLGADLHL